MAAIINKGGRLFERVEFNDRGYNRYQLVEEAPLLIYSRIPDHYLAITQEDGRLYNINRLEFCQTEESGFKSVYEDLYGYVYALNERGEVYCYEWENGTIVKIGDGPLATGVKFLMGSDYDVSAITDDIMIDFDHGAVVRRSDLSGDIGIDPDDEIIDAFQGVIITSSNIYSVASSLGKYNINISGKSLIGMGVITPAYCDDDHQELVIILEDNGELVIQCDGECVENQFLNALHQNCPWIEVLVIEDNLYLLNSEGVTAKLGQMGTFTSTKIPPHIFKTTRMKNANTKL